MHHNEKRYCELCCDMPYAFCKDIQSAFHSTCHFVCLFGFIFFFVCKCVASFYLHISACCGDDDDGGGGGGGGGAVTTLDIPNYRTNSYSRKTSLLCLTIVNFLCQCLYIYICIELYAHFMHEIYKYTRNSLLICTYSYV